MLLLGIKGVHYIHFFSDLLSLVCVSYCGSFFRASFPPSFGVLGDSPAVLVLRATLCWPWTASAVSCLLPSDLGLEVEDANRVMDDR